MGIYSTNNGAQVQVSGPWFEIVLSTTALKVDNELSTGSVDCECSRGPGKFHDNWVTSSADEGHVIQSKASEHASRPWQLLFLMSNMNCQTCIKTCVLMHVSALKMRFSMMLFQSGDHDCKYNPSNSLNQWWTDRKNDLVIPIEPCRHVFLYY